VITAIAMIALTAQTDTPTTGKVALLEPTVVASVFTNEGARIDPFAAASRVAGRMRGESGRWEGWDLKFCDYKNVLSEQKSIFGNRGAIKSLADRDKLARLASKLQARYVAFYNLLELTGARTGGVSARTTGRASINLTVYDAVRNAYVWNDQKTETSIRKGTKTQMQPRIDQALLNSIRLAMEPFATKGLRKEIKD
jgi:hypothetical protein